MSTEDWMMFTALLSLHKMCASVSRGSFVCRVGDQGKFRPLDPWRGSVLPVILTRLLHPRGLHVCLRMPVCLFSWEQFLTALWMLFPKDHEWNLLNSQFFCLVNEKWEKKKKKKPACFRCTVYRGVPATQILLYIVLEWAFRCLFSFSRFHMYFL